MSQRRRDANHPPEAQALTRLLDLPQLAEIVPRLAPAALHRLLRHAGIEGCVDLVEAATGDQLRAVLHLDLWGSSRAGQDDVFDAERFGEWVEALVDRDAAVAARLVARIDLSLAVSGLSAYVRVLDPGVLEPTASTDDEWESGLFTAGDLSVEVGGYIVQARRRDAWDAVVSLLVELSSAHRERFEAVMRGCRRLSDGGRESGGLHGLLEPPEQQLHDLALDREERRAERGFTARADARAFLALARQGRSVGRHQNLIAAAYLRRAGAAASVEGAPRLIDTGAALHLSAAAVPHDPRVAEGLDAFARVFAAENLQQERPASLGGGATGKHEAAGLRPLLEYVREQHPEVGLARERELAFLANALVTGCSLESRSFTPREAFAAATATCSLGLLLQAAAPGVDYLVGHDLIAVFEDGWAALHRDVSMFVAEGLLATLQSVSAGHSATLEGLQALRRSLERSLAAGTPWLAQESLDVLSTLDTPAGCGLLGLLSECPVIPGVVTAIVERHAGRIDPKAFAFIATAAQIDTVRAFMARLPLLLTALSDTPPPGSRRARRRARRGPSARRGRPPGPRERRRARR